MEKPNKVQKNVKFVNLSSGKVSKFYISAYYIPKNKRGKKGEKGKNKEDEQLSPFLESATTFLKKISDDKEKPSCGDAKNEQAIDKATLFANSIVPDLQKFDDEHFALIKMIIAKDIYDVYLKQKGTNSNK